MLNDELSSIVSGLKDLSNVEKNSGFWGEDEVAEVILDVNGEHIETWVGVTVRNRPNQVNNQSELII